MDRVGTLVVVGYSRSSQIPIDGGINSTESQWAPARSSLREHINQPVTVWDKTFTRWKKGPR